MIRDIFLGSVLIVGMVCNAVVACIWARCIFKNPEATKASMTPVLVAYATTDIVILVCIMHLFKGGLPVL